MTMRKLSDVIDQILAALPAPFPPEWNENLTALTAELKILRRKSLYQPPEAVTTLWNNLGQMLYRYLPPPTATPWAMAISLIVVP
jgi:hypothetical protein